MEEPSILDYLKAKLSLRHRKDLDYPWDDILKTSLLEDQIIESPTEMLSPEPGDKPSPVIVSLPKSTYHFPWRAMLALAFALVAQRALEPPDPNPTTGIILYLFSLAFLIWAIVTKEWEIAALKEESNQPIPITIHTYTFLISLPFMLLAFLAFSGNEFNGLNLFLGLMVFVLVFRALWIGTPGKKLTWVFQKIWSWIKKPEINLHLSSFSLLLIAAALLVIFFRVYNISGVPGEMFSDHAEKLADISDVLNGQTSIFFPRNTGREAVQMYLTAAIILIFKTGLTFTSLKIGTILAGLLTLPYIYLLGKEVGNRWVGLLALVLAGIAYWPNVISRVSLRFPLYPLFIAPLLFYFVRGLRTSNRNDFIFAGIALGLGLYGYSPMRIVPFVLIIAVGLYLVHAQSRGKRLSAIWSLAVLAIIALIIFLPLLRYWVENPDMFDYRALTRLTTTERAYPGPLLQVFLDNLWRAMIMFFWNNGDIWVHSIPNRPALDVVSAALFFIGTVLVFVRYIRKQNWLDLFLILSIPLLMMPSILSLAFPEENPSLNRTGGAIIPVFLIAAIALEGLLSGMVRRAVSRWGKTLAVAVGLLLLLWSSIQNYDLVFRQYRDQFMAGAWNTSDIGGMIREFADTIGTRDTAYVVPFPYWVDTRLVGINAGFPEKDYALWPEKFAETLAQPVPKLFILKSDDTQDVTALKKLYPDAITYIFRAQWEGKDFVLLYVLSQPSGSP